MAKTQSRRLSLRHITYSGDNLGSDWSFRFTVEEQTVSLTGTLSPGGSVDQLCQPVIEKTVEAETATFPVRVIIDAEEADRRFSDPGTGYANLDIASDGPQEVEIQVTGQGGRDSGKTATLLFTFVAEDVEDPFRESPPLPAGFIRGETTVRTDTLPGLEAADLPEGPVAVSVTLIGIENAGQSIGPDLSFDIRVNGYGQGARFSENVNHGGVETNVPVFSHVFREGLDARLGLTIAILEKDPVYDDYGIGGGFIDTYLEGVQQITIPVVASGGDAGKRADFVFSFLVKIQAATDGEGTGSTTAGGQTGGGTVTTGGGEPTGDDPRDVIPPEECTARLQGPDCTCIDGMYHYRVLSNCKGTCEDWRLEDKDGNKSKVAKITKSANCTATVLILSHGLFFVKVTFKPASGGEIKLTKQVEAHGVFHVRGNTKDAVVGTVPLVQPHPFPEITVPAATAPDGCLTKGADFLVHEKSLTRAADLLHHSDPDKRISLESLGREHLQIQIKVEGTIADFFRETTRCHWVVVSQGGRSTSRGALRKKKEFDDPWFKTKIPGEDKVAPHVIMLTGLGRHHIRMVATNPIMRSGTDWITAHIRMSDQAGKEIAKLRRHLAQLMSKTPGASGRAAHNARITNTIRAIEQAYLAGLANPCIEITHNFQAPQTFALTPPEMTRTQGRFARKNGPDELSARVRTESEIHDDLVTKEEKPQIYLNQKPVRNYWVTQENYGGQVFKWPTDGLIRGKRAGSLTSEFACCDRSVPVFGVESLVPDCVRLRSFDQTMLLKAQGEPAVAGDATGKYRWSVIAKPNKDAKAEITPSGWTAANTAHMKVDTAGRYTVKVEYQLERSCSLTFALSDIQVIKTARYRLQWELHRVGSYGAALSEHLALPYYQERKDDAVRAAEMLITPAPPEEETEILVGGGTSTGTGSSSGSGGPAGSGPSTLGKRFRGSFVIPGEITFAEGAIIRTYFKPYSPGLTKKDYQDFAGAPGVSVSPGAPYQMEVNVDTDREIHAVHLMNIEYLHVQRHKGQAIPISFAYQVPEEEICPGSELNPIDANKGWHTENPPLVNLILFNRDLGRAEASNAFMQLSNVADYHNVPNGNLFFDLPLFTAQGHGEPTDLALVYNSLQAAYQDSLEYYHRLNKVPWKTIERHWGRNIAGKGWSHSYNMSVRYYILPRDVHGRRLEFYAELVGPDGNRIQFRQSGSEQNGADGTYSPVFESEHWLGRPEPGHALQLQRQGGRTVLSDLQNTEWVFDKDGRLTSISTPLTRNTYTPPLTLAYSGDRVTVTDSRQRKTTLRSVPAGTPLFTGQIKFKTTDGQETALILTGGRLQQINRSNLQLWRMGYHREIGQGQTCALLKTLTDPLGHVATYDYYTGGSFHDVPVNPARNFWGRLGRFRKGRHQERILTWFYEGFDPREQTVVFRNAGGVESVTTLDVPRLAAKTLQYIRKDRDQKTGEMKNTPHYNPVGQDSSRFDLRRVNAYSYYKKTKLLSASTDIYREITRMTYQSVGGRGLVKREVTFPDRTTVKFEYDSTTHLPSKIFTPVKDGTAAGSRLFTEYRYDTNHQVRKVIHPSLRVDGAEKNDISEEWTYEPDTGQLTEYTDVNGTRRTYQYNEAKRDPHHTGLATSMTVHLKDRRLTWQTTYDELGREIKKFDPVFGKVTEYTYHVLGQLETEKLQPIKTVSEKLESAVITNSYDALMNHVARITPVGTERWVPDEHGQTARHIDMAGHTTITEYLPTGSVGRVTNPGGHTTRFSYDELDRVLRKHYPAADRRRGERRSENFTVILEYLDEKRRIRCRRYRLKGNAPDKVVVENVDTFRHGNVWKQRTQTGSGPAFEEIRHLYDRWGQPAETQWYDRSKRIKTMVQERDAWGRKIRQSYIGQSGGLTRSSRVVYYPDGRIKRRIQEQSNGQDAVTSFTYDGLGRLLTTTNGEGTVIQSLAYTDFGNDPEAATTAFVTEFAQDPSGAPGTDRLRTSQVHRYNRRGLVMSLESGSNKYMFYDVMGRLRREKTSDETITDYTLDPLGRTIKIERESRQRDPGLSLSALDKIRWPDSVRSMRIVVQETGYTWHGNIATQTRGKETLRYTYDTHGRVILTERKAGTRFVKQEEVVYDALNRVKLRLGPGDHRQEYRHHDGRRTVTSDWRTGRSRIQTTRRLNWLGRLTEYRITRFDITLDIRSNLKDPLIHLEYDYNELGDLTSKKYIRTGLGDEVGRIDYRYNDLGLLNGQTIRMKNLRTDTLISFERAFTYDHSLRLAEIKSRNDIVLRFNQWRQFRFHYNNAGILKRYERPDWWPDRQHYSTTGIKTLFDHDTRGRLTTIREGILPDEAADARIDLHYVRSGRNYLAGDYRVSARDLGPPGALKGITYRMDYYHRSALYYQEYMHDGNGAIETSVTSYTGPYGTRKEDWRTSDVQLNGSTPSMYAYHRFLHLPAGSNTRREYNYARRSDLNAFGRPYITEGRRSRSGPFNPEFGRPEATSPHGRKLNFREQRGFSANTGLPVHSIMITEDPTNDTPTPKPQPFEVHKGYLHDAAGRLIGISHQLLKRTETQMRFISDTKGTGSSLTNYTLLFHEPDGTEMLRVNYSHGAGGLKWILNLNDAGTPVARLSLMETRFTFFETIPGLGFRLAATPGEFTGNAHDHIVNGELYYHWDHKGAVTYLTDFRSLVAADFRLSTPGGETDLFGESIAPAQQPHVLSLMFRNRRSLDPWEFYDMAPMSLDCAISQSNTFQERSDHLLSLAADAGHPASSRNPYGFTLTPFGFPTHTPSTGALVYQSTLDLFRGIGDALTVGYASKWRNSLYDYDQDLAGIRNPMTYIAGQVAGVALSFYFSAVAAPLRAAEVTWGARAAMLLTISADIAQFVQSVQAIGSGEATFFDYVGLAAPLSLFSALRLPLTRDTKVMESVALARNAAIESIIEKGSNLFRVILRPTAKMLAEERLLDDLEKYIPIAEIIKEGRRKRVAAILGEELETGKIILSQEVRTKLSRMGIRLPKEFETVGHVDGVYRQIWRNLLKEAGEDLDEIAAGHRLDLGINRVQAHFEVRMFEWAMEEFVAGNTNVKTWLMDLFAQHGASANSSMGAAVTRVLMKRMENGSRIVLDILE